MKHQVKVKVKTKETGLFGIKHDVIREQYVYVDGKTWRKMKAQEKNRPPTEDEIAAAHLIIWEEELEDMISWTGNRKNTQRRSVTCRTHWKIFVKPGRAFGISRFVPPVSDLGPERIEHR